MSRYFRDIKAISSHIAYNTDVSGINYGSHRLGLKDNEIRYRQRYLDLISNQESLEIAIKRSKII